jgi:2-polyprenyl-6-methoxyphenol hydroxylase-like FAD-dependent oxidoreductase
LLNRLVVEFSNGLVVVMNTPIPHPPLARTDVLIVGGGPVGLALACELGWRGITCVLAERRDGHIGHPKMNQVGIRTMEFCRRWGIAEEVRAQSIAEDFPRNYHYVTSINGFELARYEYPSRRDTPLVYSPEALQRCSQLRFDPILQRRAASLPSVRVRYSCEMESFTENDTGVIATLINRDTGAREMLPAAYLVACDGAESSIREHLGIALQGDHSLSFNINVFFRSHAREVLFAKGPALMQWIFGPEGMWADIVSIDGEALWRLSIMRLPPGTEISHAEAAKRLRAAVGRDFEFEILSILPWTRKRVVAERFSRGRVFLCGDAVHQMSPTGGFGMNTGIQEAVDLGWKLAATLQGWGGASLLDSYDTERRPAAQRITNEGAQNYLKFLKIPVGPEIAADTPEGAALRQRIREVIYGERFDREYDMLGATLGYRYEGSPIVVPDGTPEPPDDPMEYVPTARPGHRAPHLWLAGGDSLLDRFGRDFTLLRLGKNHPAGDGLIRAARAEGMPLKVSDIEENAAHAAYDCHLALIRPDGHVAWRGDHDPSAPEAIIACIRGA